MLSISTTVSAALVILQRAAPLSAGSGERRDPAAADLVAIANGAAGPGISAAGGHSAQAKGRIAQALFDRSIPDVNEMKVRLMERLGEELGISMEDFDSVRSYGLAIRQAVEEIRREPGGGFFLAELEKKLGLDDLGISLDTLVDAMTDPTGEADRKLEAALKAQVGDIFDEDDKAALAALAPDEIGLYGF